MGQYFDLGDTDVTVTGKRVKRATCEKCGCVYQFVIARQGFGWVKNYAFTDNDAKAQAKAEQSLKDQLETEVDPVPCPMCGRYQKLMVDQVKVGWLVRTLTWGVLLVGLAWLFPSLWANAMNETWHEGKKWINTFWWPAAYIAGGMAAFGLLVFVGYNPNVIPIRLFKRYTGQVIRPGHGTAPSGAMPAVLPAPSPAPAPASSLKPRPAQRMDTVTIACGKCGKEYSVKPEILGRKVRCKGCQTVFEAAEKEIDLSELA